MAERDVHKRNAVFECIDEYPESIDSAWAYLVHPMSINAYYLCWMYTKLLFDVIAHYWNCRL